MAKLGSEPPIRIIPKLSKDGDLPNQVSMSIKITASVKDSYNKFISGTSEEALFHMLLFWSVKSQLEY